MGIQTEIRELVEREDLTIEPTTETVTNDEFEEMQEFLEGTRNCTVGGFVYNTDGALLLVKHAGESGWIQPGGMVEIGESLETALEREIREETGVTAAVEDPFIVRRNEYVHEDETIIWYSTLFFAAAIEPTIGDDLGLEGEEIVDAQWFEQLPDQLHDLADREQFQAALREADGRL